MNRKLSTQKSLLSLALLVAFVLPFINRTLTERGSSEPRGKDSMSLSQSSSFESDPNISPEIDASGPTTSASAAGTILSLSGQQMVAQIERATAIDRDGKIHPVDPYEGLRAQAEDVDSRIKHDSSGYFEQIGTATNLSNVR